MIDPSEVALLMEKVARWMNFTSQKFRENGIVTEVTDCHNAWDEGKHVPYMAVELRLSDLRSKAPMIFVDDCYIKISYKAYLDIMQDKISTHYGYFPRGLVKKEFFQDMLNAALSGFTDNVDKKSVGLVTSASQGETEEIYWGNSLVQSLNRVLLAIDANDIVKKKVEKIRKITFTELEPIRHKYVGGLFEPGESYSTGAPGE